MLPAWPDLNEAQTRRWDRVLDMLTTVLAGVGAAVVDSHEPAAAAAFADRLAHAARQKGRHSVRLTPPDRPGGDDADALTVADGPLWRNHPGTQAVIWLRTRAAPGTPSPRRDGDAAIVVDLQDAAWPVIRHISADLPAHETIGDWHRTESQAFFGVRAATWDTKFGDDIPAYAAAVGEAGIQAGGTAIDLGCGTGRALPCLRAAVGPQGRLVGIDHTREMLDVARASGRAETAMLVQADARHLPLRNGCADAVFAAGLVMHLPDLHAGLREIARVTKAGGLLILFHPTGRAALAARHGRALDPGDPLDEGPLTAAMQVTGWRLAAYDDAETRFLAIGHRR